MTYTAMFRVAKCFTFFRQIANFSHLQQGTNHYTDQCLQYLDILSITTMGGNKKASFSTFSHSIQGRKKNCCHLLLRLLRLTSCPYQEPRTQYKSDPSLFISSGLDGDRSSVYSSMDKHEQNWNMNPTAKDCICKRF